MRLNGANCSRDRNSGIRWPECPLADEIKAAGPLRRSVAQIKLYDDSVWQEEGVSWPLAPFNSAGGASRLTLPAVGDIRRAARRLSASLEGGMVLRFKRARGHFVDRPLASIIGDFFVTYTSIKASLHATSIHATSVHAKCPEHRERLRRRPAGCDRNSRITVARRCLAATAGPLDRAARGR